MINDKWSTNRQYSFLTESIAKKQTNKQANKHKQNQQSKPARKKTNKQYLPVSDTTTSEISEEE